MNFKSIVKHLSPFVMESLFCNFAFCIAETVDFNHSDKWFACLHFSRYLSIKEKTVHWNVLITMVMIRNRLLLIAKICWLLSSSMDDQIKSCEWYYLNEARGTRIIATNGEKKKLRKLIVSDYIRIRAIISVYVFSSVFSISPATKPTKRWKNWGESISIVSSVLQTWNRLMSQFGLSS